VQLTQRQKRKLYVLIAELDPYSHINMLISSHLDQLGALELLKSDSWDLVDIETFECMSPNHFQLQLELFDLFISHCDHATFQ
jgi:hypothetical protein